MGCTTCGQIAHGAVGLAKAGAQVIGLPIDRAAPEVVQLRRDLCRACPNATKNFSRMDRPTAGLTTLSQCRLCACLIAAKTMLKSETCPVGKW